MVPARIRCRVCDGRGAVGPFDCWACSGEGAISGEYPISVTFPSGMTEDHVQRFPLDAFGIQNFYLTVRFRLSTAED